MDNISGTLFTIFEVAMVVLIFSFTIFATYRALF